MRYSFTDVIFGSILLFCGVVILLRGAFMLRDGTLLEGPTVYLLGIGSFGLGIFVIVNYRTKLKKYNSSRSEKPKS